MTELTPEERAKIYAEEKARIEARNDIQKGGCANTGLGCLGVVLVLMFALFYSTSQEQDRKSRLMAIEMRTTKVAPERRLAAIDAENPDPSEGEVMSASVLLDDLKKHDSESSRDDIADALFSGQTDLMKMDIHQDFSTLAANAMDGQPQKLNVPAAIQWYVGKRAYQTTH